MLNIDACVTPLMPYHRYITILYSLMVNVMRLTGKEILDLAEYAGFSIEKSAIDDDVMEQEFCVSSCPEGGVLNENGVPEKYAHIVTCDGCDANECVPLGDVLGTL